jgi:hypothetical protein
VRGGVCRAVMKLSSKIRQIGWQIEVRVAKIEVSTQRIGRGMIQRRVGSGLRGVSGQAFVGGREHYLLRRHDPPTRGKPMPA